MSYEENDSIYKSLVSFKDSIKEQIDGLPFVMPFYKTDIKEFLDEGFTGIKSVKTSTIDSFNGMLDKASERLRNHTGASLPVSNFSMSDIHKMKHQVKADAIVGVKNLYGSLKKRFSNGDANPISEQ